MDPPLAAQAYSSVFNKLAEDKSIQELMEWYQKLPNSKGSERSDPPKTEVLASLVKTLLHTSPTEAEKYIDSLLGNETTFEDIGMSLASAAHYTPESAVAMLDRLSNAATNPVGHMYISIFATWGHSD